MKMAETGTKGSGQNWSYIRQLTRSDTAVSAIGHYYLIEKKAESNRKPLGSEGFSVAFSAREPV
ncbi:MAG: hypothetical protein HGA58_05775 [Chlorobiaceae bacterium]|nr:hypothetical protein [Chlorobiaceae bacterium]